MQPDTVLFKVIADSNPRSITVCEHLIFSFRSPRPVLDTVRHGKRTVSVYVSDVTAGTRSRSYYVKSSRTFPAGWPGTSTQSNEGPARVPHGGTGITREIGTNPFAIKKKR